MGSATFFDYEFEGVEFCNETYIKFPSSSLSDKPYEIILSEREDEENFI